MGRRGGDELRYAAACPPQSSAAAFTCGASADICSLTAFIQTDRNRFLLALPVNRSWKSTNIDCVQDYFSASVGPVKKVILNYGPTGRSRGSATVVFSRPTGGAEAVKLDGTVVDGKKMRIEVIMGAKTLPPPQAPKPLSERVAKQPKNAAKEKPKQAGATKGQAGAKGAAAGDKSKKPKSGRAGRAKAKTAEELDAEMQDYFGSGDAAAATTNGTAQPAAATNGADTGMVDEVM